MEYTPPALQKHFAKHWKAKALLFNHCRRNNYKRHRKIRLPVTNTCQSHYMPDKTPLQKNTAAGSAILGAAFLMATSAIGPGFLTQTTLFTADLLASFGFVILVSLLLDIGAQTNIWRIITVSNNR